MKYYLIEDQKQQKRFFVFEGRSRDMVISAKLVMIASVIIFAGSIIGCFIIPWGGVREFFIVYGVSLIFVTALFFYGIHRSVFRKFSKVGTQEIIDNKEIINGTQEINSN